MSSRPGLCGACRHARIVRNRRGSSFHLCELSRVDPRFPRYPPLPVLSCAGFGRGTPAEEPAGARAERLGGGPGEGPWLPAARGSTVVPAREPTVVPASEPTLAPAEGSTEMEAEESASPPAGGASNTEEEEER